MTRAAKITAWVLIVVGVLVILIGLAGASAGVAQAVLGGVGRMGRLPGRMPVQMGTGLLGVGLVGGLAFLQGLVLLALGEALYLLAGLSPRKPAALPAAAPAAEPPVQP